MENSGGYAVCKIFMYKKNTGVYEIMQNWCTTESLQPRREFIVCKIHHFVHFAVYTAVCSGGDRNKLGAKCTSLGFKMHTNAFTLLHHPQMWGSARHHCIKLYCWCTVQCISTVYTVQCTVDCTKLQILQLCSIMLLHCTALNCTALHSTALHCSSQI